MRTRPFARTVLEKAKWILKSGQLHETPTEYIWMVRGHRVEKHSTGITCSCKGFAKRRICAHSIALLSLTSEANKASAPQLTWSLCSSRQVLSARDRPAQRTVFSEKKGSLGAVCSEPAKKRRRKRTRWQKIGRSRYNQQLLKRLLREVDSIRATQNLLLKGLSPMLRFDRPFLVQLACETSIETRAVDALYFAGSEGLYNYQIAEKVGVSPHAAGRMMKRLNRRLEAALGMQLVERKNRAQPWILTSFGAAAWRLSEEEALEEKARLAREMDQEAESHEATVVD